MIIFKEDLPMDTLDMRPIELPAKTAEEAAQLVLHYFLVEGDLIRNLAERFEQKLESGDM